MTAGHERPENRDGHESPEGHDGMDALMAAILDDPLPEGARADPAFLAAHRAATADVTLLREQLGVIADALTEPAPEQAGAAAGKTGEAVRPARPPRRRMLPLTLRAVGVAAAGALVVGGGWLVVQVGQGIGGGMGVSSKSADDGAAADEKAAASGGAEDSLLGDPAYLACEARLVVEGDVTDVERVPGTTQERVTLRITRSYKPEQQTAPEAGFVMEEGMDPLLAEGDHVLVGLAKGSAVPDVWAVGEADIAAERSAIARATPHTEGVTCE
ncbi:hypothetical protein [Streptomyces aurantiogriseus]|uniref:Uncharacterized protein n=1 Tax=Streptomyces aurantiogriseus TaxID=66870 RepID=A0A918KXY1_9ACTN|nr:hypothetical protein [Streptomyces aurantiogriseus]GGR43089.1 hypothetical protein GCM10010251_70130 [Streptomyces aurantiogriseus]